MIDIRISYYLAGALIFACAFLSAQIPISWSQNLGDNQKNIIQDIIDLDGQGCLTIGYSKDEPTRNVDLWINRFSNNGSLIWTKDFGGSGFERATAAAVLDDGNIIIVGHGSFSDGNTSGASKRDDGAILKIDPDGNLIWHRTYGGLGQDQFTDVVALPNGEFLAVGSTSSYLNNFDDRATDGWAVKINSNGGAIWNRRFGGSLMDRYTTVIHNGDGSFLIGGTTNSRDGEISNSFGANDLWLSKINASGVHAWSRNYGGNNNDNLNAIAPTEDGGYVIAATSYSDLAGQKGNGDIWVLKVSALGNQIWQRSLGGSSTDKSTDIKAYQGDGFLLTASTMSDDGDINTSLGGQDAWIAKLNASGNIEWKDNLGGSHNDAINALSVMDNGAIWLAGYSFSNDNDLNSNFGKQDGWLMRSNVESPPIVSLGGNVNICIGTEITLDATDLNCPTCTYEWNDGVDTPVRTISVTSSSTYSVTLTNSAGEMSSDDLTITAVAPIEATANVIQVNCHNSITGEISLNVSGGTGNYEYQWSNTAVNSPSNTNISSGTYFVTISDDALCEFTDSYSLDNPSAIEVMADIDAPSCNSTNQGAISLTISGGEPPYEINWDNEFIGPEITGLDPGQYTVSIVDNRNCEYSESFFLSNAVSIDVVEVIEHVSCFGKSDGSITLSASGDFPPFSFEWDIGFNSNSIIGLNMGDYTVTITDAMDCQLITQYTITEPNELEVFEEQTNTQAGQSTGRLLLNITGGTPNYTVSWSNGETGVLIDNLDAGVYSATVTDANNCSLIVSYEIEIGTATVQIINEPLELYPNPNNGSFLLDLPDSILNEYEIKILNIEGKIVAFSYDHVSAQQLSLQLKNAIPGLYILRILDSHRSYQSKLIIH